MARNHMIYRQNSFRIVARSLFLILSIFLVQIPQGASQVFAQGSTVTLNVIEFGTNNPITTYTFLVSEDNTGDPSNPSNLPSLTPMASHSPVVMTGSSASPSISLPNGRYLITVRADGYKLGGEHVTIGGNQTVTVSLISEPLPLGKIRVHVFEDNLPTNGEDDIPLEDGLGGFRVIVGDTAGQVVVDWLGNPICGNGTCITDSNGDVEITNLPRGKYEVLVLPPNGQTSRWTQTTTIEGTKVIDAWIVEGDSGNSPREGFGQAAVWVGFVQQPNNPWNGQSGTGTIKGIAKTTIEWTPPINPLLLGQPVDRPYIAVIDIGGNDEMVFLARGNSDGSFQINNVPDGIYQLAIWDEPLDYILNFRTVIISGGNTADLGEFGLPRWFGWLSGKVYLDQDRDGLRDVGETGIQGMDLAMRFRDGSLRYGAVTDSQGNYEFPEVFELEKFYISEVGFTNLGTTGGVAYSEFVPYDPAVQDPASYKKFPDALTLSSLHWAAKRSLIDWGKTVYQNGENGSISGIVQYATTRNEFEARYQATEDYEPGIPNVQVNLYAYSGNPLNPISGPILETVFTDAYEHPTGCDVTDSDGNPLPPPAGGPAGLGPNCIEVPNISNEVKAGVFDGGYAFSARPAGEYVVEVVPPAGYKIVTEEDLNTAEGNDLVPALPPPPCVGTPTLMDVPNVYNSPFDNQTMPLCDKKHVTLNQSQNAAADFYLMTDNAVPIPGRVFGFLLDDLNIETDPDFIYYGEKRGIPNTPVGVRDFTGRLITTVNSDKNGIWEVLLPSTYVADCPIPSGVCPAVYKFVGNDPGDIDNPNPNYNPNYQTITFQFDVWPGKTTFADVALFPITAFNAFPNGQFNQPAVCTLPNSQPKVYSVDAPYGPDGTQITIKGKNFGGSQGSGSVTLDGTPIPIVSWNGGTIVATVTGVPAGPQQLIVNRSNGKSSINGITFHKIGAGYNPTVVTVNPPASNATPAIQNAIDAASGNTLIVVTPGVYYQPIALNKAGVKLQGYGPGDPTLGIGTGGTVIDQRFAQGNQQGLAVIAPNGGFSASFTPQIDGFKITSARDQQDVGGGLFVDRNVHNLEIGNNLIQSNGGNFGGAVVAGQPYRGDNNNDDLRIHHNLIRNNGGFSLAGGIAIFNGASNYEIDHNQICGNYSGEYGGGLSHFGYSAGGSIHHNEIVYNGAFDEGGGILIGGEQPIPPAVLTQGSGTVEVYSNLILSNLSNDDGGGIRLLQPRDDVIDIYNNMIVNNVSTDLGGGIALDDASEVNIFNNTIVRNANTSTAEDSDGNPHGVGVTAESHSPAFQATLPGSDPGYPDPVMFNNIICENFSYTWDGVTLTQDSVFDLEVLSTNAAHVFHPTYSLLTDPNDTVQEDFVADATNSACGNLAPLFKTPYKTELTAVSFRMEPNFVTVQIVTVDLPATQNSDYHIQNSSATQDQGTTAQGGIQAPCMDFDDEIRSATPDIGADETNGSIGSCSGPPPNQGVDVTPANQAVTAVPNGPVVITHQIVNTGSVDDTYNLTASVDLGWSVTVAPSSLFVTAGQSGSVDVTVIVPSGVLSGTVANVTVTATSQSNGSISSTAIDTITVQDVPVIGVPPATFYLSLMRNMSSLGSLTIVRDEDIIGFDETTGDYVMVFDGSDVGVPNNRDVDAFDILADGTILMSFNSPIPRNRLNGISSRVDDSDIVQFHPDAPGGLGSNTSGTFTMYLKGSDVGLTSAGEDIDAITLVHDDELVISTLGSARVPQDITTSHAPWVRARDEDLLLLTLNDAGAPADGGQWSLFFDGSDVKLRTSSEDIDAIYINPDSDSIHLSTSGNFNVPGGVTGKDEDIIRCAVNSLGSVTSCNFFFYFDGSGNGIKNNNDIDAIDLP